MHIKYQKGISVGILFPVEELKVALAVLKALHKSTGDSFILEAITAIEQDLQPKKLPVINYHHICSKCFRILDERDSNSLNIKKDGDSTWVHHNCPPLKSDSKRNR